MERNDKKLKFYGVDSTIIPDSKLPKELNDGTIIVASKIKNNPDASAATEDNPLFVVDAFDVDWTGYKINGKQVKYTGEIIEAINGGAGDTAELEESLQELDETLHGKPAVGTEGEEGYEPAVEGEIPAIEGRLDTLEGDGEGSVAKAISDAIDGLDKEEATVDGTNVHVTYSEDNGVVTISTVAEDYAEITRTAHADATESAAEVKAAFAVKEGDEAKLVKASDVANLKSYTDDKIAEAVADLNSSIEGLDVESNTVDGTNVHVTYKEEDGVVTIESVSEDYATVTKTASTSTAEAPKTDAALVVADGEKLATGSDLEKVAQYAADKATEEAHRVDAKIAALAGSENDTDAGVKVEVTTSAGEVSAVDVAVTAATVTGSASALTVSDETSVLDGSAVTAIKSYIDGQAAKSTTVVDHAAGAVVTSEADEETGATTYTVGANLVLEYNAPVANTAAEGEASNGKGATITLKSAIREGETQVTYGTINVSDIVGNGVLESSAYDKETGVLTLNFQNADGGTTPTEVNLGDMLDINDMLIHDDSKKYLEVDLTGGENSQAVFKTKMVNLANAIAAQGEGETATEAVTGLVDALDAKTYIDAAVAGKNVDAEGDDYVTASAEDNKVTVATVTKALGEAVGLTKNEDGEWVAANGTISNDGLATAADVAAEMVADEEVVAAALNDHEGRLQDLEGVDYVKVNAKEDGHVTVTVSATNEVTIDEDDIASAELVGELPESATATTVVGYAAEVAAAEASAVQGETEKTVKDLEDEIGVEPVAASEGVEAVAGSGLKKRIYDLENSHVEMTEAEVIALFADVLAPEEEEEKA